jgi:quinol monooxygenase YgiN
MTLDRRQTLGAGFGLAVTLTARAAHSQEASMYGLIGKMTATPGNRDELAAALLEGLNDMPGCLSYVVAEDPENADALWITEVWDSAGSHQASLALPQVQSAIARARPVIAGFSDRHETRPIGGVGLNG